MRRLAELAQISNPYLSQLERGLSEPSVRVLNSLAKALDLSAEVLLDQAGLMRDIRDRKDGDPVAGGSPDDAASSTATPSTEVAIRADPRLSAEQKQALLGVYRSFLAEEPEATGTDHEVRRNVNSA